MKTAVVTAAILMSLGVAVAAPAPVEDIASGSPDDRVARLERIIKAKQAAEFEMQQRLDTLQQEVLDLRGLTEQQSYQINQMLQRQRQLYDDIANLSKTKTTQVASTPVNSVPEASSLGETASYERAVNLVLKERQYDEAIPAFREFIRQYPDSTYAANANYWLGQLLYNKGEFADAAKAFDTVVNQFKESNKRGDSLVKLGMIAQKRNDNATAKRYYQQVVSEYANSAAARIAKQQMVSL